MIIEIGNFTPWRREVSSSNFFLGYVSASVFLFLPKWRAIN